MHAWDCRDRASKRVNLSDLSARRSYPWPKWQSRRTTEDGNGVQAYADTQWQNDFRDGNPDRIGDGRVTVVAVRMMMHG